MFGDLSAVAIDVQGRARCLRSFMPLRATAFDANTNSGWLHIAMLGTWEGHKKGAFSFTQESFAQILENFGAQSNPIPLDYEHDTFSGGTGPKPASGWVRRLELRNNDTELWAYVQWTPKAAQMIREGEYQFCSPVVDFESINRRTNQQVGAELVSVALTNNPFLDGQHPIQLTWVAAADDDKKPQPPAAQPPPPAAAEPKGPPAPGDKPPQQAAPNTPPPPPAKPGDAPPKDDKTMATPPPPQAGDDKTPPPADGPPPPAAADPNAAQAVQDGGAEDANALLTALSEMTGLDKSQTLAALVDMKDLLANAIQKTVARDGTPAEATRKMTVEKKTETTPAQPPAAPATAAPVIAAADDDKLTQLEAQHKDKTIASLTARLDALEAERAKEKEAAVVALVDKKIEDGFVLAADRDDAIWAFTKDPARAARIYKDRVVPIGQRQTQTTAGAGSAAGSVKPPQSGPIDLSQFSSVELRTIDCLIGAHRTQEQAVAIVLAKRDAPKS